MKNLIVITLVSITCGFFYLQVSKVKELNEIKNFYKAVRALSLQELKQGIKDF